MGRDLMCRLNIAIISNPDGLTVHTQKDFDYDYTAVHWAPDQPLYAYQWKLPVGPVPQHFVTLAVNAVTPDSEIMSADDLHCTSHVSEGPDFDYEDSWYKITNERVYLSDMYWNDHTAALSVTLTSEQLHFFQVSGSVPHVSLAKSENMEWKDVGFFVRRCLLATDWRETDVPYVFVSPSQNAFKRHCPTVVSCNRTVQLISHSHLFLATASSADADLEELPDSLWAAHKYDVGLITDCEPVVVTPKSNYRPCQKQYLLKKEALEGIRPVFDSLLKAGVIVPCPNSPVRTPLFPVKKIRPPGEPDEWRFVMDLQAVNQSVVARAPSVPNPSTILSQIPPEAKYFSVIDLANAFFSVPVHKDSQYWFAFEFDGKPYCFTRLCQGYTESPTIFNTALKDSLADLTLSPGTVLTQYVDDLLLSAGSEDQCRKDTLKLLQHLHKKGHKVSRSKMQFVQKEVTFLGHVLSHKSRKLSPQRIEAVLKIPKPVTKKQMMSFLGMTGYCRAHILNYSELEAPLASLIYGRSLAAADKIKWTDEAELAFNDLKTALSSAPALALPNSDKPFIQMVDEKSGFMSSVLLQSHGDKLRPVAYYSSKLDAVAAGLPGCLRAVAAAEKAVLASRDVVGYNPLTVFVPHSVSIILLEQKTSHLSAARWLRYSSILLDMPNITIKRCNTLNPATLLPTEEDGESHDCAAVLNVVCTPRPDLQDTPLTNPDLILYVDGSSSRSAVGLNQVGFAVCSDSAVLRSGPLPAHYSAQTAELIALTEACKLAEGKTVTIYTDSRYCFGVVHDFGALWKHRSFLKSDGKPILNARQVSDLLDAIMLPARLAVVKCAAHTGQSDFVSRGNAAADSAAKTAALRPFSSDESFLSLTDPQGVTVPEMQSFATSQEKEKWRRAGCIFNSSSGWHVSDGRPCLPKHFFPWFAKWTHGLDHVSKGGMLDMVKKYWYTNGFSVVAENYCKRCLICASHNPSRVPAQSQAAHPPPRFPFQHLMMDFIELTPAEGKKYCLVVVDMFSKYVEAFPTKHADSSAVAKSLLTEILPRWGVPEVISSDNGTHFVNKALQEISKLLGFQLKTHCAYHPQSGGAVERENGTIKNKLAKCCEETGLSWPKALPLVLMYMRMRNRSRANLSPFEILFGRPANTGGRPSTNLSTLTTAHFEHSMLEYCKVLSRSLSLSHQTVKAALPPVADRPLHQFQPGQWVLIRDARRRHWRDKRWRGPFQILLVTHTAVKVQERDTWVHFTHCKVFTGTPPEQHPGSEPPT
ncbi:uncharacterized protein LOC124874432 [Girardinichthys multiradiatus]|uniref:uncharacterized protein LOC124874432 n=2 Tax=Girardinichthys multiradiatus TaxID=208333 RepID=UPI001FABED72|nr:uncharacterized protein LOC124874432 [Girardinichthys multiradiatus]